MNGVLESLRERGVLSDLDWHFAHTVACIGGERNPAVLLAAALASHAIGLGILVSGFRAGISSPLAGWCHHSGIRPKTHQKLAQAQVARRHQQT